VIVRAGDKPKGLAVLYRGSGAYSTGRAWGTTLAISARSQPENSGIDPKNSAIPSASSPGTGSC